MTELFAWEIDIIRKMISSLDQMPTTPHDLLDCDFDEWVELKEKFCD